MVTPSQKCPRFCGGRVTPNHFRGKKVVIGKRLLKRNLLASSIILIILLLPAGTLRAQDQTGRKPPKRKAGYFTLQLKNAEISELTHIMSRIIGKNIIIDDSVKGRITVLSAKRIPVEKALSTLRSILEYKGLALIEEDNLLKVVPLEKAKRKNTEVIVEGEGKYSPPHD